MAAEQKELVLTVSAKNELLRQGVQRSAEEVQAFTQSAEASLAKFEERFAKVKLDAFSSSLSDVSKQARGEFSAIEGYAERMAESIQKSGVVDLSPLIDQARQSAAQLKAQAEAAEILARADARRVGAAEGASIAEQTRLAAGRAAVVNFQQKAQAAAEEVLRLEQLQAAIGQTAVAETRLVQASGASRYALQNVGFQVQDFAVQIAGGTSALRAFSLQGPQLIGALQMMAVSSDEVKGKFGSFINFLSGPWGVALGVAIPLAGILAEKLLEAGEAAETAKVGASALSSAQGALGAVFDSTTGKIKTQNDLLLLNARLMQLNLRREALEQQRSSDEAFRRAGQPGILSFGPSRITAPAQRRLVADLRSGRISADEALQIADKLPDGGLALSRKDLQQAIIDAAAARDKQRIADEIGDSLEKKQLQGSLASDLIRTPKERKGPSAETLRQRELSNDISYTEMERAARKKLIEATGRTTASEQARDALLREDITSEADAQAKKIALLRETGKINAAEAANLSAINEQTRKQLLQNVDIERASQLLNQKADLEQHGLDAQIAMLRLQGDLADTASERKRIALQILDKEQELARKVLQLVIDDPKSTEAQIGQAKADLVALKSRQPVERQAVEKQNETAADQFMTAYDSIDKVNEAIDGIKLEGLNSLNDGITEAIMGARSLGDVFKSVANQIIADLLRIAVQKAITNTIGALLFADGGEIPKFAGGGMFSGPGGPRTDNLLALVSPGEFIINAEQTRKYLPLLEAINDNRVPKFADGGVVPTLRMPRIAPGELRAGGQGQTVHVIVEANDYFDARVQSISAQTAGPMVVRGTMAGAQLAQDSIARRSRNRLR